MKNSILYLICSNVISFVFSLTINAQIWTTYNSQNSGLAYNSVYCIAIDSFGNKWIGNKDVISKFDGTNWNTYKEVNEDVCKYKIQTIVIDSQHNVWIGTNRGGISKFDGTKWTIYNNDEIGRIFTIIIDAKNNKWIGCIY